MRIKDKIKIFMFPPIIRGLHKLGMSYEKLGKISFFAKSILLAQAKHLKNHNIATNSLSQEIIMLTVLSGGVFMLAIESLLALGLKKKGHKVTFIIDDNFLPIHELKKIDNEHTWDYDADRDFIYASKFLKTLGLNYIALSQFAQASIEYDKKYDSILQATLLKHYKVGVISEDLPMIVEKKNLIKQSIAITDYLGKKILGIKPDMVIMSHGIYSTWGPPFQILDCANIPILMYGRGKRKNTLKFDWNKTGDSWDVTEEWERVKDIDLTDVQLDVINKYLESRITHKDDVFVYNFGKETTKKETIQFLGLEADKPIYTLFTNVLWDAASAQREIAFNNPVEWVIETIKWFNEHPEKQLIVKIHPAEIVIGTNMPFFDIIMAQIMPESNIRIIKPEEKINSWSIYEITTLGIVHTTTAGMELPLVNKPCVVVSQTHFRNKGFTIDVESREEYFEILENFDSTSVNFENNRKEALKYAYLLFIRYQVPFNMFYEEKSTEIKGFCFNSMDDYFQDKTYRRIIERIEKRNPIFIGSQ